MGHGSFSDSIYTNSRAIRSSKGTDDFAYTQGAHKVHDELDPKRITGKPFGKLESRDSVDHPCSTAVILTFDVTGSNIANARIAQKLLPQLMGKLTAVVENPQIAIWANDDVNYVSTNAIQLGEFESDNRIDDTIRNIWLTSMGGGNSGESYDQLLYAAARKTVTDSWEVRHKKGYMFLYADEPFFPYVYANHVKTVFDDDIQADIPIASMIAEAKEKWDIYVLYPQRAEQKAISQYEQLFGTDHVVSVQSPEALCDVVASIIAQVESTIIATAAIEDFMSIGEDITSRPDM